MAATRNVPKHAIKFIVEVPRNTLASLTRLGVTDSTGGQDGRTGALWKVAIKAVAWSRNTVSATHTLFGMEAWPRNAEMYQANKPTLPMQPYQKE